MSLELVLSIASLLGEVLLFVLFFWAKNALSPYLAEKGKNLATKQDIARITSQVEGVRAGYASGLFVSQFRYEREYEILRDLMDKLVPVRSAAKALRPMMDWIDPDEDESERKRLRLAKYNDVAEELWKSIERNKPFYPEVVYEHVNALHHSAFSEALRYHHTASDDGMKYWEDAMKSAEKITQAYDGAVEAIRVRVRDWEAPVDHG